MLRDIGLAPANEIVDGTDLEAAVDQQVHHVAADKAGAAGDEQGGHVGFESG